MYWAEWAAAAYLLGSARAHVTNWDKGMFGLNYPNQATDKQQNYNANVQVNPLREMDALTEDQWFGHGYKAFPPAPGDFMELPSGGTYMGSLACNRAMSRMRNPTYTSPLQEFACNNIGPLHTTNRFDKPLDVSALGGTAIGIAYTSDINSVKPNDMTIISVNQASPWKRETPYPIPAGLPPCPAGGCICSWNWLHRGPGNGGEGYGNEIYNTLYRCKVTGNTNPNNIVQRGAIPKDCTGNKAACVKGPKTGLYLFQRDGNNVARPIAPANPPSYTDDWGFFNGAQNDIFAKSAAPAGDAAIVNPYATGTSKLEDPKPTATAVPTGWKAMGCTVDTRGNRFLTDQAYISDDNTISMCVKTCDKLGYGSAGLQNRECWCGNTDEPIQKAPETECSRRCPGDQFAFCGAAWRNTLYQKNGGSTGTSPIPEGWRSLGCHMEPTGKHGINSGVTYMDNLTPSRCMQWCQERRFKYAGVQNSIECYCGNTYKPNLTTGCNSPCSGDKKQKCGGENRNMVFTMDTLDRRDEPEEEEEQEEAQSELDSPFEVPKMHRHGARSRSRGH